MYIAKLIKQVQPFVSSVYKKILPLISKPALIAGAGILMGALAVNLIANYFNVSLKVKLIVVALMILIPLMIIAAVKVYGKGVAKKIIKGSFFSKRKNSKKKASDAEIFSNKIKEVIKKIKSSELMNHKKGISSLYSLPWFAVIGPSASGKSSLLRSSDLNFPYDLDGSKDYQKKGFNGTLDCDWWFSENAIFLDTAGRYTSFRDENDQQQWFSLLSILKKYRRKAPLNGVLMTLSLPALLLSEAEDRQQMLSNINNRIREVYLQLGYLIPVYFIFTKVDGVQGFDAIFQNLSEKQRHQLWGVTLADYTSDQDSQHFISTRFDALYQQLLTVSFDKISTEQSSQRKNEIFDFPHQFQSALKEVKDFLYELIKENPYQEPIRIMGAYFTSSTQGSGDKVGRSHLLDSSLAKFERIDDDLGQTNKSYFINDLFHKLIFKHDQLVDKSSRSRKKLKQIHTGVLTVSSLSLIMLFFGWCMSYSSNALLIKQGEKVIYSGIEALPHKPLARSRLNAINDVVEHYQKLQTYQSATPFYARLGLYRANSQLPIMEKIINDKWLVSFAKPVLDGLAGELSDYSKMWRKSSKDQKIKLRGKYYSTLKAYMMLYHPQYLEEEFAGQVITPIWYHNVINKERDGRQGDYQPFVQYYLSYIKHGHNIIRRNFKENYQLIKTARRDLYAPESASNLYALIKEKGIASFESASINHLLNQKGIELLKSQDQISKFYTLAGWQQFALPQIEKTLKSVSRIDWVMDISLSKLDRPIEKEKINGALASKFKKQMIEMYFNEFAYSWLKFLSSVQVKSFSSIEDATIQYPQLYAASGPIAGLFKELSNQLSISKEPLYEQVSKQTKENFKNLLMISEQGGPALEQYFKALQGIQSDLDRLEGSSNISRDAREYAGEILQSKHDNKAIYQARNEVNAVIRQVKSSKARKLLMPLLYSPIKQAWRVVLLEAKRDIEQRWQQDVYQSYQREIKSKFPFEKTAEDVQLSDLKAFFRLQDGTLWLFFDEYLKPFVDEHNHYYKNKQWLGIGLGLSAGVLTELHQAYQLSNGLFEQNGSGFQYLVYPMPTADVKEVLLESGSSMLRYQNGPQEW